MQYVFTLHANALNKILSYSVFVFVFSSFQRHRVHDRTANSSQSERLSPAIVKTAEKGLSKTGKNVNKEPEIILEDCTPFSRTTPS